MVTSPRALTATGDEFSSAVAATLFPAARKPATRSSQRSAMWLTSGMDGPAGAFGGAAFTLGAGGGGGGGATVAAAAAAGRASASRTTLRQSEAGASLMRVGAAGADAGAARR